MTGASSLPFQPQGYLSVAKNIGIKDETLDFTVIHSTARAAAVGMFTQSLFCGAPVIVGPGESGRRPRAYAGHQ